MSVAVSDSRGLHLPDLVIRGFRGIEDLAVSRLGRVNLISGKNSVGKTTLLDAVRVYAARGNYSVLLDILQTREELTDSSDEEGDEFFVPDLERLFYDGGFPTDYYISIGPKDDTLRLDMKIAPLSEEFLSRQRFSLREGLLAEDLRALKVEFQNASSETPIDRLLHRYRLPRRGLPRQARNGESEFSSRILCETLGPGLLSNSDMARFWDKVALTDDEALAVETLNLIFDDVVERVTIVGNNRTSLGGPRAVARLRAEDRRVPLKSLGDGAVRLFGVALALANSRDGFLLIDEVENGIHYSLQRDFWKMVMQTAYENNVQIFATTHSWDCIRSFAYAAMELEDVEGSLVRLYKRDNKVKSVEYSESDLRVVAEQGIEVR